jgi:hypothetical protein
VPIENGVQTPGTTGAATHRGEPLTCEQIRELPDGAEVVITWDGGNGPHPVRILVDVDGRRRAEGLYNDLLLPMDGGDALDGRLQLVPLHRVTLGWDEKAREFYESKPAYPDHVLERQEMLRGIAQPTWTPEQMAVAAALEDFTERLSRLPWRQFPNRSTLYVEREALFGAGNEVAAAVFGEDLVDNPPDGPCKRWSKMLTRPPVDATELEAMVAAAILDVDARLADLPFETPGGLPLVDRDKIFLPVELAGRAALGHHYRRAMRRAIRERDDRA